MWILTLPGGGGGAYLRDLTGEVPTNNIARFETGCLEKKPRRTTRASQMTLCERHDVEL